MLATRRLIGLCACAVSLGACFPDPPGVIEDGDETALSEIDGVEDSAAAETEETETGIAETVVTPETVEPDTMIPVDTGEPVDTSPADTVPADTAEPADTAPADTTEPADTAPADTTEPADTAPADTTEPADTAPADTTEPADTAPADTSEPVDTTEPDLLEPDTLDAADTTEPDIDPCPGGCAHLDEACRRGVCTELGCDSEPLDGPCDDGQRCTTLDRCVEGACIGDPVICEARDACHIAGVCDPATGLCSDPRKPDTTPCDDADPCTEHESCTAGVCGGGQVPDDSDDFFAAMPAVVDEVVFDDDGYVWGFVNLTEPLTNFGTSPSGQSVSLSLPAGASHGVGMVRFDLRGRPLGATMLATSSSTLRVGSLLGPIARIITDESNQSKRAVVVLFAQGPIEVMQGDDPRTMPPREGAIVTYFVGTFDDGGRVENLPIQVESTLFSATLDFKSFNYPSVAIDHHGQVALAIPVAADETAEIVGRASIRGSLTGFASFWVVRTAAGSILWSRVLESSPSPFPYLRLSWLTMTDDGDLWMAGGYAKHAVWKRIDSPEIVDELPDVGERFGAFAQRIDVNARFQERIVMAPTVGALWLRVSDDGQRIATQFAVSGAPSVIRPQGETPIPWIDDDATSAVLVASRTGEIQHVFSAEALALWGLAFRRDALLTFVAVSSGLAIDGIPIDEAAHFLLGVDLGTSDPVWRQTVAALRGAHTNPALAISAFSLTPHGFLVAGEAARGDYDVIGGPSTGVAEGERFLTHINSEDGLICLER